MKQFFRSLNSEFRDKFVRKVKEANSIIITSHLSPDDDSVSSILSLYYFLTKYLKIDEDKVNIFYTGDKNERWKQFTNYQKINFVEDISNYIGISDVLILLDGSFWNRFSRKEEASKYKGYTICIDHHPVDRAEFDLHLDSQEVTSTAELVYRLFLEEEKLDKEICGLLLLGILGDTGNFRFIDSSKSDVLEIGKKLIDEGNINVDSFVGSYNRTGWKVYKTLVQLMKQGEVREVKGWPKFMVSYIDVDFVLSNEVSDNQSSEASLAFTQYLKGIDGVDWGFVLVPRQHDKTHSVSFRSLPGSISVRKVVENMKIGGGHDRAAGGKIRSFDTKAAVDMIIDWMKKNKPVFG